MNITAIKTSTLQSLKRQVEDTTTIVAKAQSVYDSYVNKAQYFKDQFSQANNDWTVVSNQWSQFLTLKSSLVSLADTSAGCDEVSQVTSEKVKLLVRKWEAVVQHTLQAADAINLAADYINKRKASNTLISSDLVSDATQAANNANAAVALVINSFTAALKTLTAANQSTNSSNLTGLYINMASAALLVPDSNVMQSKEIKPSHDPLEASLNRLLKDSTQRQRSLQKAMNSANAEMAKAKEDLDSANAKLVAVQAALTAAQAAVAS